MKLIPLLLAGLLASSSVLAIPAPPKTCPTIDSMRYANVENLAASNGSHMMVFTNNKFDTSNMWSLVIDMPEIHDYDAAVWSTHVLLNQIATFRDGPIKFMDNKDPYGPHWVCQYETYQAGVFFTITPQLETPSIILQRIKHK